MIDCGEAVRKLWQYLEHELEVDERKRLDDHLALCRRCCGEVEFAEELRRFMKSATAVSIPPEVEARLAGFLVDLETKGAQWQQT